MLALTSTQRLGNALIILIPLEKAFYHYSPNNANFILSPGRFFRCFFPLRPSHERVGLGKPAKIYCASAISFIFANPVVKRLRRRSMAALISSSLDWDVSHITV